MYVLVAVDGTLSATEYNTGLNRSYVRQFHDRFAGAGKRFFEGPGEGPWNLGGVMGTDVDNIERDAWNYLTGALRRHGDTQATRIVLVGHSRGGHIVKALARRLTRLRVGDLTPAFRAPGSRNTNPPYQVWFLGLYDAVDMSWNSGDTSSIPENVVYYAHALRSPDLGSRDSWGNTGWANLCSDRHRTRYFFATHGALGGAPAQSCSADLSLISDQCSINLSAADNQIEGRRAHDFILNHARRAGVPI